MDSRKGVLKEFKDFIWSGDLIMIAVGLILALKVKDVIDRFMDGIVSPLIGSIIGAPSFDDKTFSIGDGVYRYGTVITAVINLVLVGAVLFVIVKAYKSYEAKRKEAGEVGPTEIQLLTEIRDSLQSR